MITIKIGRSSTNDVVINDEYVSGIHCSITLDDNGLYIIKDIGSVNGTFVNGRQIYEEYLQHNDIVKIGSTILPWQEYFSNQQQHTDTGRIIRKLTIGRAANNSIVLTDNLVSSYHAEILIFNNGTFIVKDLSSTNGTFINGRRITDGALMPGDTLNIARTPLDWMYFVRMKSEDSSTINKPQKSKSIPIMLALGIGLLSTAMVIVFNLNPNLFENTSEIEILADTVQEDPLAISQNLSDMVEYIEKTVFLVETYDSRGKIIKQGTGFFIDENGLGVTNNHVIEGGVKWKIKTIDKRKYEITEFLEKNKDYDFSVFRIENHNKKFNWLRRSKTTPRKGDEIIVLGNPMGIESTLTKGIVSALRGGKENSVINGDFEKGNSFIQIDVAISHGSSGSPVMNMRGEVIGIATLSFEESSCVNCNFAVNIQLLGEYLSTND